MSLIHSSLAIGLEEFENGVIYGVKIHIRDKLFKYGIILVLPEKGLLYKIK